jgi:hypothetical protein
MSNCPSAIHHYTSPRDAGLPSITTSGNLPRQLHQIGILVSSTTCQGSTWDDSSAERHRKQEGEKKAGERLGSVETPHVSDAIFSRTHREPIETRTNNASSFFARSRWRLPKRHHGIVKWWGRSSRKPIHLGSSFFVQAVLPFAHCRRSARHNVVNYTRGRRNTQHHRGSTLCA